MSTTVTPIRSVAPVKREWLEISYCSPSMMGGSYSSGSTRLFEDQIGQWLQEMLVKNNQKPILISEIRKIK